MLSLDNRITAIPGVTVFRDHQDLQQFYYINERPRVAMRNGIPAIRLTKYRRDITDNPAFSVGDEVGGGTLSLTVDLHLSEDELDDVRDAIEDHYDDLDGEIKLGPVLFRDGTVRISGTPTEEEVETVSGGFRPMHFEQVYGSSKPSLLGENAASFTIPLGREQATYFEQIIRGGGADISVFYDLNYVGLLPAFHVKAKADYSRIYTSFETKFGVQGQIQAVSLAADVDLAFQKLREEGAIEVEILNFSDDQDMKDKSDEAWKWIKEMLTQDFFTSKMPVIQQPAGGGNILSQLTSMFGQMPAMGQVQSMMPQRSNSGNGAPQTAEAPAGLSDGVSSTTQTNPARARAANGQPPVQQGAGEAGNAVSQMSPVRLGLSLKLLRQDERRTRTFDFRLQQAVTRNANPNATLTSIADGFNMDRLITEVRLDDSFFDRIITTVTMGQDLETLGIASVAVNMEYPAQRDPGVDADHIDGFLFRPGSDDTFSFMTFLNDARDKDYRYKMTITFNPDTEWRGSSTQFESDWITSAKTELPLAPADELERLDVEVGLSTLANDALELVEVDVEYTDPVSGFSDRETFPLSPGAGADHWRLRLRDGAPTGFRHRERYFFKHGNIRLETDWSEATPPALLVHAPFEGQVNCMVNPIRLDPTNLLQAIVDVTYVDAATGFRESFREVFDGLEPLMPRERLINTITPDAGGLTYNMTLLRQDGTVVTQTGKEAPNGLIILSETEGALQRLRVRLPGSTLGDDRVAIRVEFQAPDATFAETAALFTPSQMEPKTVVVPQPDDTTRDYRFKVTAYDVNGTPEVIGEGTSNDSDFIIAI